VRKPENREKFKTALEAIIKFYGRRDIRMVAEVLDEETRVLKAKVTDLAVQREMNRTDKI